MVESDPIFPIFLAPGFSQVIERVVPAADRASRVFSRGSEKGTNLRRVEAHFLKDLTFFLGCNIVKPLVALDEGSFSPDSYKTSLALQSGAMLNRCAWDRMGDGTHIMSLEISCGGGDGARDYNANMAINLSGVIVKEDGVELTPQTTGTIESFSKRTVTLQNRGRQQETRGVIINTTIRLEGGFIFDASSTEEIRSDRPYSPSGYTERRISFRTIAEGS